VRVMEISYFYAEDSSEWLFCQEIIEVIKASRWMYLL